MLRAALVVSALSLFACNGCSHEGGAAPADPPPAAAGGATEVHVEDDGKTIEVSQGAEVIFKLANNSGTGYAWAPSGFDAAVLAQQGEPTSEGAGGTPGGAKMDVVRFKAAAAGTTTVEVNLKRGFGTQAPARTIHVTVKVK